MKKYPHDGIPKVALENERQEGYVRIGKETIDTDRTKNNYHIVMPPENGYMEFIDQRIKEAGVKRKIKDDAIKMVSFVMTSDGEFFKDMSPEEECMFFSDCAKFVKKRYGKENVISAVVHKDETTPHLHINFVPITPDNRLCAKYYFDGKLGELQTAVYEEVGKKWGLSRGKVGSDSKHVDPKTYNKIVRDATEEAEEKNESLKKDNARIAEELKDKKEELEHAKADGEHLEIANVVAKQTLDETKEEIEQAKTERDEIIAERDKEANFNQALQDAKNGKIAHSKRGMREQIIALTADNKRLEEELAISGKDNGNLFSEVKRLKPFEEKAEVAKKAMFAVRKFEPEAFARTFFRSPSVIGAFIDMFTAPITLSRDRLSEIEDEIRREKQQQAEQTKEVNRSKYNWSK